MLPLDRIRRELDLNPGVETERLTGYRLSAVALIERWIGRNIRERPLTVPGVWERSTLTFDVADATIPDAGVEVSYRPAEADPGGARTATVTVDADRVLPFLDRVEIFTPEGGWPAMARKPAPVATFDCGIAADDLPDEWAQAAALLCRELRDGTAMDGLAPNSVMQALLAPWRPIDGAESDI